VQKIPTMYPRDETKPGHPVMPGVKPECAWVEAGEGIATRKLDGSNVKIQDGRLYKRQKLAEAAHVLCREDNPADRYLFEAIQGAEPTTWGDGIYEAIGAKIQGNPEADLVPGERHTLVRVVPPDPSLIVDAPRTFPSLRDWLAIVPYEGIVFHHPDGR